MPFGVLRVVNCEILWLDTGGRFREAGPLTWRTTDRERGYAEARQVHGLCAHLPEMSSETAPAARLNARQRVFDTIPAVTSPETSDDERAAHSRARKRLISDLREQIQRNGAEQPRRSGPVE
jgi:hypothetical protein